MDSQDKKPKGYILKQAREAQGISLETIHELTKIPMDVLKAIEEGYTLRNLSPFYFKGFMKMYAQYLNVDAKDVGEDVRPAYVPRSGQVGNIQEDFFERFNNLLSRRKKQQVVKVLAVLAVVFLFTKMVGCIRSGISSAKKESKIETEKKETRKVKKAAGLPAKKFETKPSKKESNPAVITVTAPAVNAESKTGNAPGAEKIPAEVQLTVRASKNSWLQVKSDGNVVFQSTLKQGDVESWIAKDRIEVSGKNINSLEFEVNGKMLGTLGRADRSAHKLIVTKAGLSVKK